MTRRQTAGKIRDFERTKEDAARLAECFNSFDDSDSWPGGFTGGNPFTAERIFEDLQKSKDLRTIVACEGEKIVGHCNVGPTALDKEAVYIGLLGVNPAYQGKGYGKLMLIEAAETAARFGMRRIDLHTWSGNLKAMPLYKRVGYNWVPDTRVLMESHIPGIIGCPLFSDFFKRYDWYDSLKVDIKQEMDNIVEDGIGLFKYHFEGDNGDKLKVCIDREAKGICGFSLTFDGKTLSADIRPLTHTGFIGIGSLPFKMNITNQTQAPMSYSFQVNELGTLRAQFQGRSAGTLEDGESVVIDGNYTLDFETTPLDRESTPDDKVSTQTEWTLNLGGKSISMYSGIIPNEAVTMSFGPRYPTLIPGESKTIGLGLTNNTETSIQGEVILKPPIGRQVSLRKIAFHLKPKEIRETPIDIRPLKNDSRQCFKITASIYVKENNDNILAKRSEIQIPVMSTSSAFAYRSVDNFMVLENENIRILLNGTAPNCVRQIHNKTLDVSFGGWALLPEVGYPFPRGGSEWDRKKFEITSVMTDDYAEFQLKGESEERLGLVLTNTYRVYRGRDYLEIRTNLENVGAITYGNLGLKLGGWMPYLGSSLYVPIDDQIYSLEDASWYGGRQIPKDPQRYHENWGASELQDNAGVMGFVWDEKYVKDVRLMRQWSIPRIEYDIPDLEPGSSVRMDIFRLAFTQGNWKTIRALARRISGRSISGKLSLTVRKDLEVGFANIDAESSVQLSPVMFLDRSRTTSIDFRIRVITDEPVPCDVSIRLPHGLSAEGSDTISFRTEELCHNIPLKLPLKIEVTEGDSWFLKGGEVLVQFRNRIERRPLNAVIYDSKADTSRNVSEVSGKKLHSLVSGSYRISASPDFLGNLVHYGAVDEQSLFYDTFPDAKPFIWDDKHYSGLRLRTIGYMVWDWQSKLPLEEWNIKDYEIGSWVGYELSSTFSHSPGLKGIHFKARYLLLKGTPLVYIQLESDNRSDSWKSLSIGFNGVPRLSEITQSLYHTVRNNQRIVFEPTENDMDFIVDAPESWGAYQDPKSGLTLGFISTEKQRPLLRYANSGPKGQWLSVYDTRKLSIGEKCSISGYLTITDSPDDVAALKDLPKTIE